MNSTPPAAIASNRQEIRGKCILQSRDRFSIEIKYHNEVINLFKQTKTGSYNAKDRLWNFKIAEHDEIISKIRLNQNTWNVFVEALPKWILETFKNFKTKLPSEEDIDLSSIEPTLLDSLMPFQRYNFFNLKLNFSLIKSHFHDESINLNFVLVSRCLENITKAL